MTYELMKVLFYIFVHLNINLYYKVFTNYTVDIYIFTNKFYIIAVLQVGQIQAVSERLVNACTFDG